MGTKNLPKRIVENGEFVEWILYYFNLQHNDPDRADLAKILVRDWFNSMGATKYKDVVYFWDQHLKELRSIEVIEVV